MEGNDAELHTKEGIEELHQRAESKAVGPKTCRNIVSV